MISAAPWTTSSTKRCGTTRVAATTPSPTHGPKAAPLATPLATPRAGQAHPLPVDMAHPRPPQAVATQAPRAAIPLVAMRPRRGVEVIRLAGVMDSRPLALPRHPARTVLRPRQDTVRPPPLRAVTQPLHLPPPVTEAAPRRRPLRRAATLGPLPAAVTHRKVLARPLRRPLRRRPPCRRLHRRPRRCRRRWPRPPKPKAKPRCS